MITSIKLRNYKSHRDTEISLGRFTVLAGPNGAGKTSVLEAIARLHQSSTSKDPTAPFFQSTDLPRAYTRGGSGAFEVALTGADLAQGKAASVVLTWAGFWSSRWSRDGKRGTDDPERTRDALTRILGATTLHRFDPRAIAATSPIRREDPVLDPDGGGLPDVLAALKLADDPALARIETAVRRVVPGVSKIRVRRRAASDATSRPPADAPVGHRLVLDFDHARDLDADDVSEGTLVTVALVTALCSGPRPRTLLLDQLGAFLHPTTQARLVGQIRRLVDELPDVQVVATTHSPHVLDELPPEDVVAFALRKDGSVASRRLSEHPDARKGKGSVAAGQLWSLDPEQRWILGDD